MAEATTRCPSPKGHPDRWREWCQEAGGDLRAPDAAPCACFWGGRVFSSSAGGGRPGLPRRCRAPGGEGHARRELREPIREDDPLPGQPATEPWGSDLLVDGGVVANVPSAAAAAAGANEVWALDTGELCAQRHRPRSGVGVARRSVGVQSTARAEAEVACLPPGLTVHHLVSPCVTHRRRTDFSGSAELIASGAVAALEALGGADFGPARARQRSRVTRQRSAKDVVDDS